MRGLPPTLSLTFLKPQVRSLKNSTKNGKNAQKQGPKEVPVPRIKPETRARRMAEKAPADQFEQAYQIALNIVFMEDKLDQARDLIGSTSVAIQYDNGGGQKGVRENPAFKGYTSLLKSYMSAIEQLNRLTGADADEKAVSSLAAHRAAFKVMRTA